MIYVEKETQNEFLNSGNKNLILTFSDGTVVENDEICSESLKLEQAICDSDQLAFGEICASRFEIKMISYAKSFKGMTVTPKIVCGDYEQILGSFKIESESRSNDRKYKTLVGYDGMYEVASANVTDWFNGLKFPLTTKAIRDSFFNYVGLEQETTTLPNDNVVISKNFAVEEISGKDIVKMLCEINACYATLNYNNKVRYVHITSTEDALYPSNDLYPADDLYPEDLVKVFLTKSDYSGSDITYEDYAVKNITRVQIRNNEDDIGVSVGVDGNDYIITDNILCYGMSASELQTVGRNFLHYANYIEFTPISVKCLGRPWIEIGDYAQIITPTNVIRTPILKRTMSGIKAMTDIYESRGTEYQEQKVNSVSRKIEQLNARTTEIRADVDGVRSEVSKKVGEEEVSSMIEQSAESIRLKADALVVDSKNFTLTEDGFCYIKNAYLESTPLTASYTDSVTYPNATFSYSIYTRGFISTIDAKITFTRDIVMPELGLMFFSFYIPNSIEITDSSGIKRTLNISPRGIQYQVLSMNVTSIGILSTLRATPVRDEETGVITRMFTTVTFTITPNQTITSGTSFSVAYNFFNWGT